MPEFDGFSVEWDPRGFIVLTVNENHVFTLSEAMAAAKCMRLQGVKRCGLLVQHIHRYELAKDLLRADLSQPAGLQIVRTAYFAPEEWAQPTSHVSAETAMRNVPTRIFVERGAAVAWLLEGLRRTAARPGNDHRDTDNPPGRCDGA